MIKTARFILRNFRRFMLVVLVAALMLASNILLLTVDAAYDAAKRGLWALASIVADVGTPRTHRGNRETLARLTGQTQALEAETDRLEGELRRSRSDLATAGADNEVLERRVARLSRERTELEQQLRVARRELTDMAGDSAELAAERATLSRRLARLEGQSVTLDEGLRARARAINERLARRTSRSITTNLSSMSIEAVPYVGAAAIVGVTFMEVRDACLTLKDTRELLLLFSGEPPEDVPACGYSPAEFWGILAGGPDAATCRDLSSDMPAELRLDCPDILRPGESVPLPSSNGSMQEDIRRPGD